MSLARQHRDKFLANSSAQSDAPTGVRETPVVTEVARVSPARRHRDRTLATMSAASAPEGETPIFDPGTPHQRAAAQMQLRLTHDLRRLRDIQSIERKIAAKREMLPAYADWVDGLVQSGVAASEEVLPTVMIWRIDTGDFAGAMPLIEHVLAHDLPLPSRYERSAPALIVEEIADAAAKLQLAGQRFPLDILTDIDALTCDIDMHDQIRAKLHKAIGIERQHVAEDEAADPMARSIAASAALDAYRRAQSLDPRVGVKDRTKRLEKLLSPPKDLATKPA